MKSIANFLFASTLFSLFAFLVATVPAKAITAELANKCRTLAIKAHPPQRTGTKAGTASDERKYYRDCVTNGGSTLDDKTQNPPAAPVR